MEGELIIASITGGLFGIVTVILMQKFWIKRWEMNYSFEKYKFKERQKGKKAIANPTPKSAVGNLAQLIPIISTLSPEQIDAFKDMIGGEDLGYEGEDNITDLIMRVAESNPDLVKSFLKGLTGEKKTEPGEELTPQG